MDTGFVHMAGYAYVLDGDDDYGGGLCMWVTVLVMVMCALVMCVL